MTKDGGLRLLVRCLLPALAVMAVATCTKEPGPSRDPVRTQNLPVVPQSLANGATENQFALDSFASGIYLMKPEGQEVMVDVGRCKPDFFQGEQKHTFTDNSVFILAGNDTYEYLHQGESVFCRIVNRTGALGGDFKDCLAYQPDGRSYSRTMEDVEGEICFEGVYVAASNAPGEGELAGSDNSAPGLADPGIEVEAAESGEPVVEPAPESEAGAAPQPEADQEPVFASVETDALGIAVAGWQFYNIGNTIFSGLGESRPDPTVTIKADTCSMGVDVASMPATHLPANTPQEAPAAIFQRDYVEGQPDIEWSILEPAAQLDVNGAPAARMLAERYDPGRDSRLVYQLTVIQSATRAAVVEGRVSKQCADNYGSVASLTEIANSVRLYDPTPTCLVGSRPGTDPVEYAVACDGNAGSGPMQLNSFGHSAVEIGPVTWDECALFMKQHGVSGW